MQQSKETDLPDAQAEPPIELTLESLQSKIPPADSKDVLAKLKLDYHIFEYVEQRIGDEGGNEQLRKWNALPEAHRLYYATWQLQGEVNNGGFGQYFQKFKKTPSVIQDALDGMRFIGADAHVALANEAIALYVHFIPELEPLIANPKNGIQRLPKVETSDIDARFQLADPQLQTLRLAFAKKNLPLFVTATP